MVSEQIIKLYRESASFPAAPGTEPHGQVLHFILRTGVRAAMEMAEGSPL